mgnify:CR=1 FL=1
MDIFHVIVLSLIEGLTEFLPISSTAHLVLASNVMGIVQNTFLETFQIAIQMGAIAAVIFLYFKKIISNKSLLIKSCIAFLPTGILGFVLLDYIRFFLSNPIVPVTTLFLGGILILGIEWIYSQKSKNKTSKNKGIENLSYKDVIIIGLIQSVSLIPGVSRAAASIYAGLAINLDRKSATEFSFLLAIPTITVASAFELISNSPTFSQQELILLICGILFSFLSAIVVIKWFIAFVSKRSFMVFGVYRIILSILYYFLFLK